MRTIHILLIMLALADVCLASESNILSQAEQNLRVIWTASDATVQQRAAAVNSCFTNGIPIRRVLGVLGKWDEHHQTFATVDRSELAYRSLLYRFGSERITIRAKGTRDKRTEDCVFAGAFAWKSSAFGQPAGWSERGAAVRPKHESSISGGCLPSLTLSVRSSGRDDEGS